VTRIIGDWRAMSGEQRLAVLAAFALLITMFFPWYSLQALIPRRGIATSSVSAFGVFSFVEAAVLLVSVGVIFMMFARSEGRAFHLPGGDGWVVMIAGGWVAFLLFYRVFDRPNGHSYPVGIDWGFFLAFVAAGALCYTGLRIRRAHVPEPPLPGEPVQPSAGAPADPPTAATRVTRRQPDDPGYEGQLTFDDQE
jgi:hypothetical protein